MSGIERGLRNISVLHAVRIARALEVALADLLRVYPSDARLSESSPWIVADHGPHLSVRVGRVVVDPVLDNDGQMPVAAAIRPLEPEELSEWEVGRYLSLG
jgi:hypothetical protein